MGFKTLQVYTTRLLLILHQFCIDFEVYEIQGYTQSHHSAEVAVALQHKLNNCS